MTDVKGIYNQWLAQIDAPIFLTSWWLDAVCGAENWQPIVVQDKLGKVIAAMYYYMNSRWGLKYITQAPLTPFSGIWLAVSPKKSSPYDNTQHENELIGALIAQLPKVIFFQQCYHFTLENWLPFHWAGYTQTTRYTHILNLSDDFDSIFAKARHDTRKNYQKANRNVTITTSEDFVLAYRYLTMTGERHGHSAYTFKQFENLAKAVIYHKQGCVYIANDAEGQTHAAAFVVWDNQNCYFLASGMDIQKRSAAISGIIWRAIADAKNRGQLYFDFDGSMLQNVENVTRGFGAERKPYHKINAISNRFIAAAMRLLGR